MNNTANPQRPRHIHVHSWHNLSPNLRRIVFHSPELADYPFQCNGAHIKILLPLPGQTQPVLPEATAQGPRWADAGSKPLARTYTLRHYDAAACTLSIDFVLHGHNGPASAFALNAAPGQTIGVSAPAGPAPMLKAAEHYLFAGDLSALPAISAMLEDMDDNATGDVWLWLPEHADLPADLPCPAHVKIHPFFGAEEQQAALLADFQAYPRPADNSFVWLAGEAALVAALRHQARQIWQIPLARCYAVPYWRRGETEEIYHAKRHDFMDSDA